MFQHMHSHHSHHAHMVYKTCSSGTSTELQTHASDRMNGSNGSALEQPFASILGPSGYLALYSLSLIVICPAQLFLNGLTMSALLVNPTFKSIPSQRNVLINITAVGLLTGLGLVCFDIAGIMLTLGLAKAGTGMCTVVQFIFHTGILTRNLMWVTLTVVIFVVIHWGVKKVKAIPLLVAIIVIWIVTAVSGIPYFTPIYDFNNLLDGVICLAQLTPPAFIHQAIVTFTMGLPTHFVVLSFVVAAVTRCRSTQRQKSVLRLAMVKFIGLLLIVNFVTLGANLFAIVPYAFRQSASLPVLVSFHLFSYNLLLSLPGIVTPLLMVATFRPVRRSIKTMLTCGFKQNKAASMKTSPSPQS